MSRLSELERELEEVQDNPYKYLGSPWERIRELKAQIAVEKWLDEFGSTDRERD